MSFKRKGNFLRAFAFSPALFCRQHGISEPYDSRCLTKLAWTTLKHFSQPNDLLISLTRGSVLSGREIRPIQYLSRSLSVLWRGCLTTVPIQCRFASIMGVAFRIIVLLLCVAFAFGAIIAVLQAAPTAGTSCDEVSLGSLVVGVLPRFLGGDGSPEKSARTLAQCGGEVSAIHPSYVVALFSTVYIALQTCAIPGPIVLSVAAGAIWGLIGGQLIVATCATAGATFCNLLSSALAGPVFERFAPAQLARMRSLVQENRHRLFWFMLFLRFTPLVPNWAVNAAAPLVGVPLGVFVASTALGLLPANFIHCSTGVALRNIGSAAASSSSLSDSAGSIALLFGLQFLALLPALLMRRGTAGKAVVEASPIADAKQA